ncbi:MAG TPA: hypothetical protein PK331_00975 [Gordonia sp. (in: high G+C Gram-positive bacteria)]|uniref:hypothetical protein n=1 Tax=unclassified Gordonia (in: high G+C Gram-positive bacteria) TaxID=2657482 RepID=UPI0025BBEF95|nr:MULTISPECIES: hypothetical protein [unclassified Gordonia (in: high G+C Gram-positive bacteria)]HNP55746.1 hypothetical protein [Gordonia sp. (in: high G+C Gram-positive bacteria)]HRC49482.1 hypothetical protein [Gordonia sp. (in: high G+C Gram-positive bacteria)]
MKPSFGTPRLSNAANAWQQLHHLDDRERQDRLAADRNLLAALQRANFTGPDWTFVERVLAEYGVAVIASWIRKGTIASKCAEKNVRCPDIPDWVRADKDSPDDIATETVAVAIVAYRDNVLAKGIWDPTKGASLKTFFINQCLFKFANAYRFWKKGQPDPNTELVTDDLEILDSGAVTSVEDDVIRSQAATMILQGASNPRAARVLAMAACGYSNAAIAADLGVSVNAVKGILKRERASAVRNNPQRGAS